MSAKVVVVGSLNADLTAQVEWLPRPGETVHGSPLALAPGGKSANQAAAASRLGAKVALLGAVGDDANGGLLLNELRAAGVDVEHVLRLPETATGTAVITVDAAGENTIVLSAGANGALEPSRLGDLPNLLRGAGALCLGYEIPLETVAAAAHTARSQGVRVILNPSPSGPVGPGLLGDGDLLIVNGTEAADLLHLDRPLAPGADWERVASQFATRRIAAAVVTLGAEGAVVLEHGTTATVPPTRITPVDTTGSGDAFTGALAWRLAAGDSIHVGARVASRAAAWAATKPGAQRSYATLAELDAWDVRSPD